MEWGGKRRGEEFRKRRSAEKARVLAFSLFPEEVRALERLSRQWNATRSRSVGMALTQAHGQRRRRSREV